MAICPACASEVSDGIATCPLCGFHVAAPATSRSAARAPVPPGPRAPTRPSAVRPPQSRVPSHAAPTQPASTHGFAPLSGGDPYIGRTIAGKFQVLELIGQGGMGRVYKARHATLDRLVCVKLLRPALLEDQTVVGRFEREAKAASRLNHPHSIQVLDFGQDELGALYLVMEYVAGRDLRLTLRDEFPLGEERICHVIAQVLSALDEAHAQSVIHRDLKPENIMLEQRRGEPDYVKVLDFGIAKIQDPDVPGLTRADVVCGTPHYMSPEQATGSAFDARADLYAVGVILYQLTTGTLPFDGRNSMEVLTKHVNEQPEPPRARRPELSISPEMESLILRALDKDPANRPQTAKAFRVELLRVAEGFRRAREETASAAPAEISSAPAEDTAAVQARALPKSRLPVLAGLGVGTAALGIAAWTLLRTPAPVEPAPVAALPSESPAPVELAQAEPAVPPEPAVPSPTPEVVVAAAPAAPRASAEPRPAAPMKGDSARARELVDEADLLVEEGHVEAAIQTYRKAIEADPSFARAFRGLFRAGSQVRDTDAMRQGANGYLRLSPDAPDAAVIRRQLELVR